MSSRKQVVREINDCISVDLITVSRPLHHGDGLAVRRPSRSFSIARTATTTTTCIHGTGRRRRKLLGRTGRGPSTFFCLTGPRLSLTRPLLSPIKQFNITLLWFYTSIPDDTERRARLSAIVCDEQSTDAALQLR